MEKAILFTLLLAGLSVTANSQTAQRFQADKFLDMLARTFDTKTAFMDLLNALQRRLNLAPTTNTTDISSTGGPAPIVPAVTCPAAQFHLGASVTYTSNSRSVGSRALYECTKGYSGRSVFIQCMAGGHWSSVMGWTGCIAINCGHHPHLTNADVTSSGSAYGSVATYKCRPGYTINSAKSNVTCLESGMWETVTFKCDQVTPPPAPANNGFNMAAMASLMSSMGGEGGRPGGPNPMLAAMMKSLSGGFPMVAGNPSSPQGGNNIVDMIKMMSGSFQPTPPPPATTPPPPKAQTFPSFGGNQGGFQLPNHIKSLLPSGLSNGQGFKPQDLMTLSSTGGGAGPRDITSLMSSMNPLAMLTPGSLGLPGLGGRGRPPMDPELMAEQREEMMMRAMMAQAMKSMMGGGQTQGNGTNSNNGGMNNMMTMMALQNGMGGAGGGGGAGGMDALIPMLMGGGPMGGMYGGMGGGGLGGLLSGLFGGA